jgi:hypothetical protein
MSKVNNIMSHQVLNIFPVPLIQIEFDKHDEYYFEDIEKSVNLPEGWEVPLNSTFPEIPNNDSFITPIVRDSLIIDLTKCIKKVFEKLNLPTEIYIDDFWYNIYHEDQGQEEHDHLGDVGEYNAFWSGIYYNKNASPTCFIRSDRMYKTQSFPESDVSDLSISFDRKYFSNVKDGDILLFPPYLEHYVMSQPWHKDNMRLTFAFNICRFKK